MGTSQTLLATGRGAKEFLNLIAANSESGSRLDNTRLTGSQSRSPEIRCHDSLGDSLYPTAWSLVRIARTRRLGRVQSRTLTGSDPGAPVHRRRYRFATRAKLVRCRYLHAVEKLRSELFQWCRR